MLEIKQHPVYSNHYFTKDGRFFSTDKWNNLFENSGGESGQGYIVTSLRDGDRWKTRQVHRLIMETWKPHSDSQNLQVNHIDGNKKNNHIDNLEWCTPLENIQHSHRMGLQPGRGKNKRR